ncbi:MAG: R3H domain-containing nucleic acid-binding protein [Candidatus Margulisiibacteriota bacterium]|jgi:spoIIIJ-associated protein
MNEKKGFFSFLKGIRTSYDQSVMEEHKQREYALQKEENPETFEDGTLTSENAVINEIAEESINKLSSILQDIGYKAEVKLKKFDENRIFLEIITERELIPNIIGKEGSMLNSLQIILNAMLYKKFKEPFQVLLDIDSYKQKRLDFLKSIALNAAENVIQTKESVELKPMPAFDRRFIHLILENNENIKSYSIGEQDERRIVLEYKNNE